MKTLVLFILASICMGSINIQSVRSDYKKASFSVEQTTMFHEKLKAVSETSSIELRAYQGASFALMAKYEQDIKNKTSLFKKGVAIIEKTIHDAPANVELRLIRLSVQQNAPKIMKYKRNIEEDKAFIFNSFSKIKSANLKSYIKDYINESGHFTNEEKKNLDK